ncbi:MAG: flagellin B [Sulfurospirillum sp.]|nr:flagellin B [Sulfurospirillum sp.]
MGFRINTNIAAMNAHTAANVNNRSLDGSLAKLSSGLRINTAADDASGLAIADSLRSQASTLGQAIANANDGVSMLQIADKAMDEQLKILDTIKVKATQAAQDGQSADSRKALQADITRLMGSLDNIASTTSFNGKSLLSGQFTNAQFQVGAYTNQTISASIGATSTDKIGQSRFETTEGIAAGAVTLTFTGTASDATKTVSLESVIIGSGAEEGVGVLAETINKNSDLLGVKASYNVSTVGTAAVAAAATASFGINGVSINVTDIKANDSDGKLVAAINAVKESTGVSASVDSRGNLVLSSTSGRAIDVSGTLDSVATGLTTGNLTLTNTNGADIKASGMGGTTVEATINLRSTLDGFASGEVKAMGAFASGQVGYGETLAAGVNTYEGAQAMMTIAESAIKRLDTIRGDIGSTQNQMISTINNISVTQVNVKAAESQIRDVDFAAESANFSKYNILAQSGSYAMSQANAVQQNVLRLLQ